MAQPDEKPRLFTWSSGGIVLLITGFLVFAVIVHRGFIIFESLRWQEEGTVPAAAASHGFDLSRSTVPVQEIFPSGNARDFFRPMDRPATVGVAEAEEKSTKLRKLMANAERVVGVDVGGEQRAYPIRILSYHEIVNDVLGGVPIAVTYSPLCDAVVVFDRRVAGETLEFAYSGLLHDHNLLFYDRRERRDAESLWCQLQGQVIAGPRVGTLPPLVILPSQLTTWDVWKEAHPATTAVAGKASYLKKKVYDRNLYGRYHFEGDLKKGFPLRTPPPSDGPPPLARVIAFRVAEVWHPVLFTEVKEALDGSNLWQTEVGGDSVTLRYNATSDTVEYEFEQTPADLAVVHCFWFAWHSLLENR